MADHSVTNKSNKTISAGAGEDRLVYTYSVPASGVDMFNFRGTFADGYSGTLDGFADNNVSFTGFEHFTITMLVNGTDSITTGAGDDIIATAGGDDYINSGAGTDQVDGGAGIDNWHGDLSSATANVAIDINGDSSFLGSGSVANVEGFGVSTGSGNDRLTGHMTSGQYDTVNSGAGNDAFTVHLGGWDTVNGGKGFDRLTFINNYDFGSFDLTGVVKTADGWAGTIDGYANNNVVYTGIDTITFIDRSNVVDDEWLSDMNEVFRAGGGNDILRGGGGRDQLLGQNGTDMLWGGDGNDRLVGGNGADRLHGDAGNDVLTGGNGADTLNGGDGDDILTGNKLQDTFVYTGGADRITDYRRDMLHLDDALWGGAPLTNAEILAMADRVGGDTVFDFGGGNTLTLDGYTNIDALDGFLTVI